MTAVTGDTIGVGLLMSPLILTEEGTCKALDLDSGVTVTSMVLRTRSNFALPVATIFGKGSVLHVQKVLRTSEAENLRMIEVLYEEGLRNRKVIQQAAVRLVRLQTGRQKRGRPFGKNEELVSGQFLNNARGQKNV